MGQLHPFLNTQALSLGTSVTKPLVLHPLQKSWIHCICENGIMFGVSDPPTINANHTLLF